MVHLEIDLSSFTFCTKCTFQKQKIVVENDAGYSHVGDNVMLVTLWWRQIEDFFEDLKLHPNAVTSIDVTTCLRQSIYSKFENQRLNLNTLFNRVDWRNWIEIMDTQAISKSMKKSPGLNITDNSFESYDHTDCKDVFDKSLQPRGGTQERFDILNWLWYP